jgi:hypothetical protein
MIEDQITVAIQLGTICWIIWMVVSEFNRDKGE